MLSKELLDLKRSLENADKNDDAIFYSLISRAISLLGLSTMEISKALGIHVSIIEDWKKRNKVANFALRPWIYAYFIKQITIRDEVVSYHATDEYGYKYRFHKADHISFTKLLLKLSVCSYLLDRMQVRFAAPTELHLSFFIDTTKGGDFTCIEELHYLIEELGGKPEVLIDSSQMAMVIPLAKKDKPEPLSESKSIFRHCYEPKDGCEIELGGKCICTCCLLEKVEGVPVQSKLEIA